MSCSTYTPPQEIFEVKYEVPREMKTAVLATLCAKTRIPAKFARAAIKTTYFDDDGGTSLFDSQDGQLLRRKYRFREYICPEEGGAFYSLEIKNRFNQKTSKIKKLIYKQLPSDYKITTFRGLIVVCADDCDNDMAPLRCHAFTAELCPVSTVFYERFRFEDRWTAARYNYDTKIMVTPWAGQGPAAGGFYLDHDVFEIKTAQPQESPSFLRHLGIKPLSLSKFVWAKEMTG